MSKRLLSITSGVDRENDLPAVTLTDFHTRLRIEMSPLSLCHPVDIVMDFIGPLVDCEQYLT